MIYTLLCFFICIDVTHSKIICFYYYELIVHLLFEHHKYFMFNKNARARLFWFVTCFLHKQIKIMFFTLSNTMHCKAKSKKKGSFQIFVSRFTTHHTLEYTRAPQQQNADFNRRKSRTNCPNLFRRWKCVTAVKDIVFKIIKILLKFIIILIIKVLLNCLFTHDANLLNALLASNKIRKQKKKKSRLTSYNLPLAYHNMP